MMYPGFAGEIPEAKLAVIDKGVSTMNYEVEEVNCCTVAYEAYVEFTVRFVL